MGLSSETIAALASAPGRGGVGVIRVSGPLIESIMPGLLGQTLKPREAKFLPFLDGTGEILDRGIALFFPAPRSFTGEAVLELHAHGNPLLIDSILSRLFQLGCRPARPGEFTERAFLNQKLDLTQAEAIADLITAETSRGLRAARRSLEGEFSNRVNSLVETVIELRMHVESAIDFTDEDIDFLDLAALESRLSLIQEALAALLGAARQGVLLREGMTLVLAGKPNAGKSSLFNFLAGSARAIVTDIPGTTRDTLSDFIEIEGLAVKMIDTAGLRAHTQDSIEAEGMRRARQALGQADKILIVIDDRFPEDLEEMIQEIPENQDRLIIRNKIDLSGKAPELIMGSGATEIRLSLKTGEGLELLIRQLSPKGLEESQIEGDFMARRRHIEALKSASGELDQAHRTLKHQNLELLAEHLQRAQRQLGEITGAFTSEDLLGRIFSSFCIGK